MYKTGQMYNAEELKRLLREDDEKAGLAEQKGQHAEAVKCWVRMAENFRRLASVVDTIEDAARLNGKANRLEQKAKSNHKQPPVKASGPNRQPEMPQDDQAAYSDSVASLIHRSDVTWDDIGGAEEAKHYLKYAMGLLLARRPVELRNLEIPTRILVYGPPGTGKTLLAAAAANTLGATFYNVKVSDLLSKYFGESSKMISTLYNHARDQADSGLAVVFIDEIESLVSSRDRLDSGAEKRIMSTILAEMDGLAEKKVSANVITIAATNLPWDLDAAFLSRMDLRILMELPDKSARESIFKLHLTNRGHQLGDDLSLGNLADLTEGLAGRDIQRICKRVILKVLASVNEDIPRKVDQGVIRNHDIAVRPICRDDLRDAIRGIKESKDTMDRLENTEVGMERYRKWHRQFGAV